MRNDKREFAFQKLHRIRKNICQIFRDRQYNVEDEEIDMTIAEFKNRFTDPVTKFPNHKAMSVRATRGDDIRDVSDSIIAYFSEETKFGIKNLRDYAEDMTNKRLSRGIIVLKTKITTSCANTINSLLPKYIIEPFYEDELVYNIMEHFLVPDHQLLTKREKAALLAKYNINGTQLLQIDKSDVVARHFGAVRGDVFRIIRKSPTAGRYVTYRHVA